MVDKKTTKEICLESSRRRLLHKEQESGYSKDYFNKFYFDVWVSQESMIKELKSFETDVKYHFDKVTNPKLNVIRAINTIINKLLNNKELKEKRNELE